MPLFTQSATVTSFAVDDFVLYRDPARFWTGQAGHTFVCRIARIVRFTNAPSRYDLQPVTDSGLIPGVQSGYLRLLPPVDAMRDIDTAPLRSDSAVDDMTAGAMAWLAQQAATTNRRPELPPH
ncbi:hypothetical protein [Streptomyces sp. NRRL F-5065]|uniref:hypothetical protein n=1 Tax=Streptomyces sp. NRRL F-5065 TaxID=1463855 RepID=UPI0004C00030|nr:hypothetical protein [Streptomyces sp. NRRL F-5065]